MSNQQPPQVEWPSEWDDWGRHDGRYVSPIKEGNAIYDECEFLCDKGFLLAPDGTASKCPVCMD